MADTPAPTVDLVLDWDGDLRFSGHSGAPPIVLDSEAVAGPTPVQALAYGLAGCMAMDVVHVLRKGRHPLARLRARLHAERAAHAPKRLVHVRLHFEVVGAVPPAAVERAIQLSRETYCSVWHTLRQDLDFETKFEVLAE